MWIIETIVVVVFCWALWLPTLFSICFRDTVFEESIGWLVFYIAVAVFLNGLKVYGYIPV